MPSLIMLSPAPLIEAPAGEVVLDVRFVEGMKLHCQLWPGPVRCVMRRGPRPVDVPMRYTRAKLGFELIVLDPGDPVPELLLDEASVVYVAADDMQYLHLPQAMRGRTGKLVFTIEEALAGRMMRALRASPSIRRRLGALKWALGNELRLRRGLAAAAGVHCNGYPAHDAYRGVNARALRYLDNRMRLPMIVRGAEQQARADYLLSGAPLRLTWFGQMTPESGVEDLLPMAHLLAARGVPFGMTLYGDGPLAARLRAGFQGLGLEGQVTLAPQPQFDPVLVPRLRREADVFLMPRHLPDPQGAYVEAMGCGLPILGYGNRMWRRIHAESGAGWVVGARPSALARAVERLHGARGEIVSASARAVDFARGHSFESVFARRMTDLRDIARIE